LTFAVLDIETTGSRPQAGNITELAVRITDGQVLLAERHWLIRPEAEIPAFITALTGIDDAMVSDQPDFAGVAEDIHNFLEGHILVAHNAAFDYVFLKASFQALSMPFNPAVLCTVQCSRKAWPGLKSYGLGALCSALGIPIQQRHRAGGDADATLILFHRLAELLGADKLEALARKRNNPVLPAGLQLKDIPETAGVYLFVNAASRVLYVGKAKNIRKRVLQHFRKGALGQELLQEVTEIRSIPCGNELMALITESEYIREHWPPYNKAGKFRASPCLLSCYHNREGVPKLALTGTQGSALALLEFAGYDAARKALTSLLKQYGICPGFNHSSRAACAEESCYCKAPRKECISLHSEKVLRACESLRMPAEHILITGPGRSAEEISCVWMEHERIRAYGYLERNAPVSRAMLETKLSPLTDHPVLRSLAACFAAEARMQSEPYQLLQYPNEV